jgi:hypothetical protein
MQPSNAIANCEVCEDVATVHIVDTQVGTEHLYCPKHNPSLPVGERLPRLAIKRWRIAPNNGCSQRLSAPKESAEHQALRYEICDLQTLGSDGACRYYLSLISGTDQFLAWNDQFLQNVEEYVISQTSKAASQFFDGHHTLTFFVSFLRRRCDRVERDYESALSKQENAVDLLLNHPDWTDEEIASRVGTTLKQLQRWRDYAGLRTMQKRRLNVQA